MSAGLPYIGSKISLISQSDVRYEGILYTIDTVANTVALAKVRSFGTEDRPTDRPMPPREEEYEYIIFRATDLKDIRVLVPPNPQATLQGGLSSDPAIVKHSKGAPVGSSKLGYGAIGSQTSPEKLLSGSTQLGNVRRSPMEDSVGLSNKDRSRHNSQSSNGRGLVSGEGGLSSGQTIGFLKGGRGGSRVGGGFVAQSRGNQSFRGRGFGRGGYHQPGRPQPEKEALRFDSEYDFEQANIQFQDVLKKLSKTKLGEYTPNGENGEEADGVVEAKQEDGEIKVDDDIFYDKQKSFFDSISCEALERSKGKFARYSWKAEKRLNKETFGVTGNRRYGDGGGRGRYYNRGGRGYSQGSQGYGRAGYERGGQRGLGGGYTFDFEFKSGNSYGRGSFYGQGNYRVPRAFDGGYMDEYRGGMGGDRIGRCGYGRGGSRNQGIGLRRPHWGGVRNQ